MDFITLEYLNINKEISLSNVVNTVHLGNYAHFVENMSDKVGGSA